MSFLRGLDSDLLLVTLFRPTTMAIVIANVLPELLALSSASRTSVSSVATALDRLHC